MVSEVDIRYKIYLCQMKLKDYKSAQKTVSSFSINKLCIWASMSHILYKILIV